jgi:hypothetical protein
MAIATTLASIASARRWLVGSVFRIIYMHQVQSNWL